MVRIVEDYDPQPDLDNLKPLDHHIRSQDTRWRDSIPQLWPWRRLGRGNFARVWSVKRPDIRDESGEEIEFAVKVVRKPRDDAQRRINGRVVRNEASLMSSLDHPHILKFIGVFHNDDFWITVLELADRGSLDDHLRYPNKSQFKEEKAKYYLRQVLKALIYLHSRNIIHRDLRPENCLLKTLRSNSGSSPSAEGGETLVLSDFDWAIITKDDGKADGLAGDESYHAPEVYKGEYTNKVDIWALA